MADHAEAARRAFANNMEGVEPLRLEGLEDWLLRNAIRGPDQQDDEETEGRQEERARVEELNNYEASLHRQFFPSQEAEHRATHDHRQCAIHNAPSDTITLRSDHDPTFSLVTRLLPMAMSCDTIYALVTSYDKFQPNQGSQDSQYNDHSDGAFSFSIPFPADAIYQFVDLVMCKVKLVDLVHMNAASDVARENHYACHDDEHVLIVVTRIAHYMQNAAILKECITMLMDAIDTENCLSISQLADHLHLPQLFERALSHMMDSMDNIAQVLQQGEQDDVLTRELRERIEAIQTAVQTSLHSNCRSRLYFSSLQEYIAIFAERVQYYKERLAEAEEQQGEQPVNHAPGSGWQDAQRKIDQQKVRVRTLEAALREQKKMFARMMQSS